jgi:uncharacterized protein YjbJ (UPF0337 family)
LYQTIDEQQNKKVLFKSKITWEKTSIETIGRELIMNKHQSEGNKDQVKGELKRMYGKATGNEKREAEGNMDKAKGKLQETWGDAKEAFKDKK